MSIATKVFIVLVMVLSVVFSGYHLAYYATRENYKAALNQTVQQYDELKQLFDSSKTEQQITIQSLKSEVADLQMRIKSKIDSLAEKDARIAALEGESRRKDSDKENLQSNLNNAQAIATEISNRIDALEKEKANSQKAADSAMEQLELAMDNAAQEEFHKITYRQQTKDLTAQLGDVQEQLYQAQIRLRAYSDAYGPLDPLQAVPVIEGKIVGVGDDHETVVINRGEKDQVKIGYVFNIRRGNSFIGKARVDSVQQDLAVAYVLKEFLKGDIKELDDVSTR
ncbi:MAG: hypothetical protein AB7F75_06160 [Planctomycetota bacterium]